MMEKIIFNENIVKELIDNKSMFVIEESENRDIIMEKVLKELSFTDINVQMVSLVDDGFQKSVYYKTLREHISDKEYCKDKLFIFTNKESLSMLKNNNSSSIKFIVFTEAVFNYKEMDNIYIFDGGKDKGRMKKNLQSNCGEILKAIDRNKIGTQIIF